MNEGYEVSVVLGSLNRFEFLKTTIMTVRNELGRIDSSEIIVVDGGSTDGSVEWLTRQKDIILILQHNHGVWNNKRIKKQSWGYYMNLGFKSARYNNILMISDDCLLIENAVLNGLSQIKDIEKSGGKVGGLAFLWRHWPDWEKYGVAYFYNKAHLNHGIYLKKALEHVGYADETTYSFYAADVDLSFKLHDAGLPVIVAKNSYLEHHNHISKEYKNENYSKRDKEEEALLRKWSQIWGEEYFESNIRWRREVVEYTDPGRTYRLFQKAKRKDKLLSGLKKIIVKAGFAI